MSFFRRLFHNKNIDSIESTKKDEKILNEWQKYFNDQEYCSTDIKDDFNWILDDFISEYYNSLSDKHKQRIKLFLSTKITANNDDTNDDWIILQK
mmetsp:Transcript_63442/g.77635  ORF Transcript_63442/g.77635 Transcript_63442/m.77635 type:complete len:95 (-) Transcript_63442:96-380(-)